MPRAELRPRIRRARAADRWAIRRLVYAARLNPRDLDWRRFLVAELDGRIVGTIQARHHADGTRELASLAVHPALRGLGVGTALIAALRAQERGPLYLSAATTWQAITSSSVSAPCRCATCRRRYGPSVDSPASSRRSPPDSPSQPPRVIFMRAE